MKSSGDKEEGKDKPVENTDKEITLTFFPSNDVRQFSEEYRKEIQKFGDVIPDRKLVKPVYFVMDSSIGGGGLCGFIISITAITPVVLGYLDYLTKKRYEITVETKNVKIKVRNPEDLQIAFRELKEYERKPPSE